MLDLVKLGTFLAVARHNSFTRAAIELGYSQSNVTTQIQGLEHELGAPLFDRVSKRVILTEIGRQMLDYSKRLLALANEAKAAVHKQSSRNSSLSLGAPEAVMTYRLPRVLREFQALFPGVRLNFDSRADFETRTNDVRDGKLDIAVVVGERIESGNLTRTCLGTEKILIVKAPDYPLVRAVPFRPEDVFNERVLLSDKTCTFRQLLDRLLREAQVLLANTLELGGIEVVKQWAVAGMGLAFLPEIVVKEELKRGQLVSLPWPGPVVPVYIQAIRHSARWTSPAQQALWDLIQDM